MKTLMLVFGFLLSLGCAGTNSHKLYKRIIGGRSCGQNEALHYVGLSTLGSGIHCGGTLIHPNWVLTAAHCNHENLQVIFNLHPNYEARKILEPAMKINRSNHDVMLIYVQNAPPQSVVRIPTDAECNKFNTAKGFSMEVAGFGVKYKLKIGPAKQPSKLQCVTIKKNDKKCAPPTFCAGAFMKDTRSGDSGGGLVNSNVVYGIVSYGYILDSLDRLGLASGNSGYLSVCYYHNWINNVISTTTPQINN